MTDPSTPPAKAPTVRSIDDEPASTGDAIVPPVADWQQAADQGFARRSAVRHAPPPFQPASTRIPRDIHAAFVAWARDGLPNEACGIIAAPATAEDGGLPSRFLPMRNAAAHFFPPLTGRRSPAPPVTATIPCNRVNIPAPAR